MKKRLQKPKFGGTARMVLLVLVAGLAMPMAGSAHPTSINGWEDNFETAGPLPGTTPADPYEIKSGSWNVVEQSSTDNPTGTTTNHVLLQSSKASTPVEPIAFVRGRIFKSFTAQVTAAFADPPAQAGGDPAPNSGLGMVFRAPITEGVADKENLYLYSAVVTGVAPSFPTGKALVLLKRIGRGYYLATNRIVSTWADFTKPHEYKVSVGNGHIMCFFDGRLVIDTVDAPSPDQPTIVDPLPGLPWDSGAVGLRTSAARAWFDDLTIVGNDAYEGRAMALDVYAQYGSNNPNIRRGVGNDASQLMRRFGIAGGDTGFVYHDHDFSDSAVGSVELPGGQPSVGAEVKTSGTGGVTTSVARLAGVSLSFTDPNNKVTVVINAKAIETSAVASCTANSTSINIQNGTLSVILANPAPGVPDAVLGPVPLKASYPANTTVLERTGFFSIIAHARNAYAAPQRADVSALKIVLPDNPKMIVPATTVPNVPNGRVQEVDADSTPFEINIANAVAARYCS